MNLWSKISERMHKSTVLSMIMTAPGQTHYCPDTHKFITVHMTSCLKEGSVKSVPWCMRTQFTSYFHMFLFKSFLKRPWINHFMFALWPDFWRFPLVVFHYWNIQVQQGHSYLHWIMKHTAYSELFTFLVFRSQEKSRYDSMVLLRTGYPLHS